VKSVAARDKMGHTGQMAEGWIPELPKLIEVFVFGTDFLLKKGNISG
jgi:hypothetical protein